MKFKTISRSGLLLLVLGLVIHVVAPLRAENRFERPVWRVQLRVLSARAPGTASATDMLVSLNRHNETWLTYPPRLFDDSTYDLLLTNVNVLGEITDLVIIMDDRAGWCPNKIELIVNEMPYFEQRLKCPWAEDQWTRSWFMVRRTEIHANASIPLPAVRTALTSGWLQSLTESAVNQAIHEDGARWGHVNGRKLEVSPVDLQTVHVDLSLASETPYPVHVAWDVRLECQDNQPAVAIENYHAVVTTTTSSGVDERNLDARLHLVDSAAAHLLDTLARWHATARISAPQERSTIPPCLSFRT
jgi:hypothetical protein